MKTSLAALAALTLLAACASQDTARLDALDDATCQGRGLAPGSDGYRSCRSDLQASRAAQPQPIAPYRSKPGGGYGY